MYPHQIAFNVLPQVDSFLSSGYTKEEMKMENEGRKIMHHPKFRASVTCVRVPVFRAHSVAISAEFEKPVTVEAARAALTGAPGLDLKGRTSKNCRRPSGGRSCLNSRAPVAQAIPAQAIPDIARSLWARSFGWLLHAAPGRQ